MATNNPRVAAYLLPKNFERLKAFSKGRGLSLSQAIDTILSEYFGGESPSNTPQIETRLAALEASLKKVDSLNFEVVVTNEAIAAIQADLARLNSVLFSSTSTAPDPQTNSRVSEPISSTASDEVALKPQTTPSVSEPISSTPSSKAAKPDPQTQPIISELLSNTSTAPDPLTKSRISEPLSSTFSDEAALTPQTPPLVSEPLSNTLSPALKPQTHSITSELPIPNSTASDEAALPELQTNSIASELPSSTLSPLKPQTNPIVSEPLSSTDETQPNPSSGEAGELLSSLLGSTSDSPSPEPLLEKDALKALASVEPNPSGDLEADVLLNDTLSGSQQLGSDGAESTEARSSAATSEPQSSLLKSEDENGQLYQQAIKRAKELKKKRLTQSQMADTLNAEGFTTITGKKWTRAAISRLFS